MQITDEADFQPSEADESYWETLLQEGEAPAESVLPLDNDQVFATLGLSNSPVAASYPLAMTSKLASIGELQQMIISQEDLDRNWRAAEECLKSNEVLELKVMGYNRGGLLVEFGQLQGFIPASQVSSLSRGLTSEERLAQLAAKVGKNLRLHIIEIDRSRNRLIMAEFLDDEEGTTAEEVLANLYEGQVVRGRVSNICDFGAFVALGGGIEGLIHVSELAWHRVEHPRDMLRIGQELEAYVISVDRERRRVGLSLKRLTRDPWSLVNERYEVGQLVQGTITNVVSFGAFARIPEGVEGLIHISELAEGNFLHPRNVVKEGDVVTVRILNIDSHKQRLGLSLRQAWMPQDALPQFQMPDLERSWRDQEKDGGELTEDWPASEKEG